MPKNNKHMYYLHKQICLLLLLVALANWCRGQDQIDHGVMFHGGIRDTAGNLWFATTGKGVYRYDASSRVLTNLTEKDGLCANNVSNILEDKAGNLWFSTELGICRYDGRSFTKFITKETCAFDLDLLLEDRNGFLWFGTNGYGLCRYDPVTEAVTNFTKEQGLGSDLIQCILEDKAGNLWVGERDGGVCRYDSISGTFTKVNAEGISSQIMGIVEDKNGNIWFANLYQGLCRYEPALNRFTHLTEKDGMCGDVVTCIYEDKKGNLWFGSGANKSGVTRSEPGGLCRYDGRSFTGFTAKDGLANMDVWTIVEDNDGNIWVGTRGGLYRYHSGLGRFIDFTHKVTANN